MFKSASIFAYIFIFSRLVCVLPSYAATQTPQPLEKYPNLGRTATPQEIKAWDIDVRPDFKGLPAGSGSVKQGEVIWEAQCASCHGHFGESAEVFTPIAGGVTADDMRTGRVKSLLPGANQPQRTTLMKLSTLSTLWDYINRAMPWNAPKSLSADQVFAVTAYTLHLNNILPADFVLSDRNMRAVQAQLPNRNGMTTAHSLWSGAEFGGPTQPDVQGSTCRTNCAREAVVISSLPDHARDAHGNLAEQSRTIGPSRGAETVLKTAKTGQTNLHNSNYPNNSSNTTLAPVLTNNIAPEKIANISLNSLQPVLDKNACLACHGINNKLVGPSFKDIAARYQSQDGAVNWLSGKIKNGGQGAWGAIPMPAQALSADESTQIAQWLMGGMAP